MRAIGIDIGTTSVCGVVIDAESGRVIRSRTENSNAFLKGAAEWERIQSVERIMAIATEILEDLLEDNVAVIGVTGQMHGIVYLNAAGDAISPLYTWQDVRGNQPFGNITYAGHLGSFAGYGNVTDLYNRENGIRPAEAVRYCTIHDYFVMKLCGLQRPLMHASNAASLGCYDLVQNRFNYDLDVEVVTDYCIAGYYHGIPVSVAIGDNQASVFSTLAGDDRLLLNIGTGSQVSIVSDHVITGENIETRPYFEGKYLVVGSALCGGRAYSLLKNFYAEILGYASEVDDGRVYAIMDRMLQKVKTASLAVNTRFAGTRSDPTVTGSITGLTTENFNPSQLTLGVLEGIAAELYEMYEKMGVKKCGIVGSGNGIRKNPALAEVFERLFGAKMAIPAHLEEASFGAALFGLISAGVFQNAEAAQAMIKYERS